MMNRSRPLRARRCGWDFPHGANAGRIEIYPPARRLAEHRGWRAAAVCVLLLLAVLLVFGQTLGQEFVNYDDDIYVYSRAARLGRLVVVGDRLGVYQWSAGRLVSAGDAFPHARLPALRLASGRTPFHQRFVARRFDGDAVFGPVANDRGTLAQRLVAALFGLHPLRVESVAWIAERRDVLSGLFFMLTLGAYVEYVRRGRSLARYLVVCAMLALGLLAKSILVTLPALLLLLDFWPLGRLGGASAPRRAASLAAGAVCLVVGLGKTAAFGVGPGRVPPDHGHPRHAAPQPVDIPRAIGQRGRFLRGLSGPTFRADGTLGFLFLSRGGPPGLASRVGGDAAAGHHAGRADLSPIESLLLRRLVLVRRHAAACDRTESPWATTPAPTATPICPRSASILGWSGEQRGWAPPGRRGVGCSASVRLWCWQA